MSQSDLREPQFSAELPEDLVEYRPVSHLAIAAFVTAVLSISAIFSPLLLFVPVIAIVLALAALSSIKRDRRPVAGKTLAFVALAGGIFFGSWAVTRSATRSQLISGQAQNYARQWLEMVRRGELEKAHQLSLRQPQRITRAITPERFYQENEQSRKELESFFSAPPLDEIVNLGERGDLVFVGDENLQYTATSTGRAALMTMRFRIEYDEGDATKSLPFFVEVARGRSVDGRQIQWRIVRVSTRP